MTTISETGHAINIANLIHLISFLKSFGALYNPSNLSLTIENLEALLAEAQAAQATLNDALPLTAEATKAREAEFKKLSPLATRALNALIATKTSEETDESAKAIVRKIRGERATPAPETSGISTSQQSFDSVLENFDKFIRILEATSLYIPNEVDLKPVTLRTFHTGLTSKNLLAIDALVSESTARITRNKVLYTPLTGLIPIASDVKTYVKSVFGPKSPEYKEISGLAFRNLN